VAALLRTCTSLRNALDYVPRKIDDDCLRELRWLYDRRDLTAAGRDLAAWLAKWQAIYPKLCAWVEEHIAETLTFYRLPRQHPKHLKSTDEIDKRFVSAGCYDFAARATAWQRARPRPGASPGCLIRMHRRSCGARAPAGWRLVSRMRSGMLRERGAASALQQGWRGAPRDQAAVVVARRFVVGLGCHWATKC
jgi:hypothetical protein